MAKTDTWMPLYVGDYLADTQTLSTEEHGAYLLLLLCFWLANGKLPDDDEAFAAVTKTSVERWTTKLRPKLTKYFVIEGGVWTHNRVVRERLRANDVSEKRRLSGLQGGRPKKQTESKPKANGLAKAKQNETQSQSQSQSQVQPNLPSVGANESRPASSGVDFVTQLAAEECYKHIDVRQEFGKMQVWCRLKGKQPSQARFVNWLNRCDKPLPAGQGPAPIVRISDLKTALTSVEARIQYIKGKGYEDAGKIRIPAQFAEEYKSLTAKYEELNKKIRESV